MVEEDMESIDAMSKEGLEEEERMEEDGSSWKRTSDGLPSFADERCRRLMRSVSQRRSDLDSLMLEIRDEEYRKDSMSEHMKIVDRDVRGMQDSVQAAMGELESSLQLKRLADMEWTRLKREKTGWEKQKEGIEERRRHVQVRLAIGREKLNKFRQEMKWNEEQVSQWMKAASVLMEDKENSSHENQKQNQELRKVELRIGQAAEKLLHKEEELRQEVSNAHCAQAELNNAAAELKTIQKDCNGIFQRFLEAEKMLKLQESRLKRIQQELNSEENAIQTDTSRVSFLEAQHSEVVLSIEKDERDLQSKVQGIEKLKKQQKKKAETLLESELLIKDLQRERNNVEEEREMHRQETDRIRQMLRDRDIQLGRLSKQIKKKEHETLKRLKHMEERDFQNAQLNGELEKEEICLKKSIKKLRQVEGLLRDEKQKTDSLAKELEHLKRENDVTSSMSRNLESKAASMRGKLDRQDDSIASLEDKIDCLEWRIKRVQGEREKNELQALHDHVAEMESELLELHNNCSLAISNANQMDQNLKALDSRKEALDRELKKIMEACEEEELQSKSIRNEVEQSNNAKVLLLSRLQSQESEIRACSSTLFEEDSRLERMEKHHKDLSSSLETFRVESEKERIHKTRQLKESEDDIRKQSKEIQIKDIKLKKLEDKLDIVCQRLPMETVHNNVGISKHPISSNSEERQLLEEQKRKLTSQITSCKEEIDDLQVSMADISASNRYYRHVEGMGMTADEYKELESMRAEADRYKERLEELRKKKSSVTMIVQDLESQLARENEGIRSIAKQRDDVLCEEEKLRAEVSKCLERYERAATRVEQLLQETNEAHLRAKILDALHQMDLYEQNDADREHPRFVSELTKKPNLTD